MKSQNTIIIGESSRESDLLLSGKFDVSIIRKKLESSLDGTSDIHIVVEDSEQTDLYVAVSYLLRELFPVSKLTCITASRNFLEKIEYFNHLTDDAVVIGNQEFRQEIYDSYALFDEIEDYYLIRNSILQGKYDKEIIRLPDQRQIEESMLVYIYFQMNKREMPGEKEGKAFLRYLGLDSNNLRNMLSLENPFEPLSEQDYTWSQIYGKNPVLDVGQYMKESAAVIRETLENIKEEVMGKIEQYFFPSLAEKRDACFAFCMLDQNNEFGLYQLILREMELDYGYLLDLNKSTYEEIKEEDTLARNERAGIFGHRKECVDDLFASIDTFLQQRYEIYRYKIMEEIYQTLLDGLKQYDFAFPKGRISVELQTVFDRLDIYSIFSRDFLETFDIRHFVSNITFSDVRECLLECQGKGQENIVIISKDDYEFLKYKAANIFIEPKEVKSRYLKSQSKRDISPIVEAVQNKCLSMKNNHALLKIYGIISHKDYNMLSLPEILELLYKLRNDGLKPEKLFYYEIENERDYESLLDNDEFMENLSVSLKAVYENRRTVDDLQKLL